MPGRCESKGAYRWIQAPAVIGPTIASDQAPVSGRRSRHGLFGWSAIRYVGRSRHQGSCAFDDRAPAHCLPGGEVPRTDSAVASAGEDQNAHTARSGTSSSRQGPADADPWLWAPPSATRSATSVAPGPPRSACQRKQCVAPAHFPNREPETGGNTARFRLYEGGPFVKPVVRSLTLR